MKSISTKILTRTVFSLLLISALAWATTQGAANRDPAGTVGVAPVAGPGLKPFRQANTASGSVAGRSAATEEAFGALTSKAEAGGTVRVIVGLDVPFQPEGYLAGAEQVRAQRGDIARAQAGLLRHLPAQEVKLQKKFTFIPYVAMEVGAEGLARLQNSPAVVSIEEDIPLRIALGESVPLIGTNAAWESGFSGSGQTVAILDTGVDRSHPFLAGRVVSEACYSTDGGMYASLCPGRAAQSTATGSGVNCSLAGVSPDCAHGTQVAGIAAGWGGSFSGVAKHANIIAIQVFSKINNDSHLEAHLSNVEEGLQRVDALSSSFNIAAVNLSLAYPLFGEYRAHCDDIAPSFRDAVANLRSKGIATIVASGNGSRSDAIWFPSCLSNVVSVGSTDDGSLGTVADQVSDFSNSAPILTLLAPGRWLTSSVPGGGFQENLWGTSMAAPHVTGAWAVLKSRSPSATVEQVLNALTSTGLPVRDARNNLTRPRIRIDAALGALGQGGRANVALASGGAAATASSTYSTSYSNYPASAVINGDRRGAGWGTLEGGGWNDVTYNTYPDWVQIDFNGAKTIDEIDVFTLQDDYMNPVEPTEAMTFTAWGITAFDVQYWTGSAWASVPAGSVSGNNKVWRKFVFPALTTGHIRILVNNAAGHYSRITEVEAWGTAAPPPGPKPILNYAHFERGSGPNASSWLDLNRVPIAAVNGDRRGLHWGSDPWTGSGWHDATNNAFPDWFEVEFNAPQVINEVDVFSVQDNFQNPAAPTEAMTFTLYGLRDFDVEYWTGSGWAVVPGGAVVGNNKVWVKLTFPPVTTTRMRVVVNAGLSGYSRIVEFEAWGWDP